MLLPLQARLFVVKTIGRSLDRFSKDDADVKDDKKTALYAHLWMCHTIFTSSLALCHPFAKPIKRTNTCNSGMCFK